MRTRLIAFAATLFAAALPTSAQAPVESKLYTRTADGIIRAAIAIDIEPGWHLYNGPTKADLGHKNAVGMPTSVEFSGIEGVEWSAVRFPEPHKFDQSDIEPGVFILGHEGQFTLYAAGRLPEGSNGEGLTAKLKGLVCEVSCLPYRDTLTSSGSGPDALFESFPADLAAPPAKAAAPSAPQADSPAAPTRDKISMGEADATLYVRTEGKQVRAAIEVELTPGWHLYHGPETEDLGHPRAVGKPTQFRLHGEGVEWKRLVFPEPHEIDQSEIEPGVFILAHEGTVVFYARGELTEGEAPSGVWGEVKGQTCEESCLLYKEVFVDQGRGPDAVWAGWDQAFVDAPADAELAADTGDVGGAAAGDEKEGLMAFLLLAIAGGLFALVMPCTYPMIPITISFFTKQADSRGGSVLPLSLAYGAGIVLIFVLIGVVFGSLIIPFATHPVTNLIIGIAFVYFAFVLFGVINLQPPRALMNAAGQASMKGGYLGVFLMGTCLVVTSFTCTAPFVGSLLSYGASEGDLGRVALGMAVFGLTMAVPFVLLSLLPGRIQAMPKSGQWMNTFKFFLGFVELAAALKFFSNSDLVWGWSLFSREVFLALWALIFVVAGLYLLGVLRFKDGPGPIGAQRKLAGVLTLAFAGWCTYGFFGNKLDRVMTAIAPNYSGGLVPLSFYETQGTWAIVKDDYDEALQLAANEGKLLLVNFTGHT